MDLGKAGWLHGLLEEAVSRHRPESSVVPAPGLSGRAAARAYLRRVLRETGLLYGTPAAPTSGPQAPQTPEQTLFLAVIRTFARIALDVAVVTGAPAGPRREQLLMLFAALTGLLDDALAIQKRVAAKGAEAVGRRLWGRVETALERRAVSLLGDPAYGIVLHNGAVYADAQLFGRLAIELFARGELAEASAKRRLEFSSRQKAVLVEVLTALACVEHAPSFASRRAILRQIDDLQLPLELHARLRANVKRAFERRPSLQAVAREVRSRDLRRFILEQTVLASLVDGHRSPRELAFLHELGTALGVTPEGVREVELSVAEFYAKNRSVVDVFTVSAAAGVMGEEAVDAMQRTVEKNFHRLMREVRETGELSVLLTKAARGHPLSELERRKMREQLLDVAKAIPALAIFAAPGGVLLLIALAKVLPFNILPSAFQDDPSEADRE